MASVTGIYISNNYEDRYKYNPHLTTFKNGKIYSWYGGNGAYANIKNTLTIVNVSNPIDVETIKDFNPFSNHGELLGNTYQSHGCLISTYDSNDSNLYFLGKTTTNEWVAIRHDLETKENITLNSNFINRIGVTNYNNVRFIYGGSDTNYNNANGYYSAPLASGPSNIFFEIYEYYGPLKIIEMNCKTGNIDNFYTLRTNVSCYNSALYSSYLYYSEYQDEIYWMRDNSNVTNYYIMADNSYSGNFGQRHFVSLRNPIYKNAAFDNHYGRTLGTREYFIYASNMNATSSLLTNYSIYNLDSLENKHFNNEEGAAINKKLTLYGNSAAYKFSCFDTLNRTYYYFTLDENNRFLLNAETPYTNGFKNNAIKDIKTEEEKRESKIINSIQRGSFLVNTNGNWLYNRRVGEVNYGSYRNLPVLEVPISEIKPNLSTVNLNVFSAYVKTNGSNHAYAFNITPSLYKLSNNYFQFLLGPHYSDELIPVEYEIVEYKEE